MSNTTDIFGFRIYTGVTVPTDTSIGLYAVSGANSELRYSEAPLAGTAEAWATGFLTPDGIGEISEAVDTRRGGGVVQLRPVRVVLRNTERLRKQLEILGMNLSGAKCDITEFIGTTADSDATERTVMFTGTCEDVQWSETTLALNVVPSLDRVRRTNLMKNGSPVTFGSSDPVNGRFFKMNKIDAETTEKELTVKEIARGLDTHYPPDMKLFPSVEKRGELTYQIRIGRYEPPAWSNDLEGFLNGKYMLCAEGPAENQGAIRKVEITGGALYDESEKAINITISDYLPKDLPSSFYFTAENQAFIKFLELHAEYEADSESCGGFIDPETGSPTSEAVIYGKNENGDMVRVPPIAAGVTVNNNRITLDPLQFRDGLSRCSSFFILPVENFGAYTEPNLSKWAPDPLSDKSKIFDGVYGNSTDVTYHLAEGMENVTDKDPSTYARLRVWAGEDSGYYYKWLRFTLPKLPAWLHFNAAYFGVNLRSACTISEPSMPFRFVTRRYFGGAKTVGGEKLLNEAKIIYDPEAELYGGEVHNIMDSYYNPAQATKNKDFFRIADPVSGTTYDRITGYDTFKFAESKEEYTEIEECAMVLSRNGARVGGIKTDNTWIHEVCVILETEVKVGDELYAAFSGRTFNDTWGGRKDPNAVISNPIDVLEHIKRNQIFNN